MRRDVVIVHRPIWRRVLDGWLAIMARFGEVQTLVLLGLVYALVIGPAGLGAALARRDFLDKSGLRRPGTAFRESDSDPATLDRVKQPF